MKLMTRGLTGRKIPILENMGRTEFSVLCYSTLASVKVTCSKHIAVWAPLRLIRSESLIRSENYVLKAYL